MFKQDRDTIRVLLVHPGGPFWAKKDLGAWSLPKGEYPAGEDAFAAALREFGEETGMKAEGTFLPLGEIRQPGGKVVTAWAFEGDCDAAAVKSNSFSIEWPRGSGTLRDYPEIDRADWFTLPVAREKILKGQVGFLERLASQLDFKTRKHGDR